MNDDFLRIQALEGELKHAHKKRGFGLTVSTKELVYQKPHANYYIRLEHIMSITPYQFPVGSKPLRINREKHSASETVTVETGMQHYRFYVSEATLHNRSGIFTLGASQFILPVRRELLLAISSYGGLNGVDTMI
ncbi:hypothetical protein [Paenibacillus sp. YYML68]|uniref:hypothetical protein n=1 Tax=Paenibacillus sp. YYML68 TaxID=2909250 RepID=UPI00248FC97C|nr:hypothetical protein [Paenibacillus sp. YYML68]